MISRVVVLGALAFAPFLLIAEADDSSLLPAPWKHADVGAIEVKSCVNLFSGKAALDDEYPRGSGFDSRTPTGERYQIAACLNCDVLVVNGAPRKAAA